jgi:hypothetical protein
MSAGSASGQKTLVQVQTRQRASALQAKEKGLELMRRRASVVGFYVLQGQLLRHNGQT